MMSESPLPSPKPENLAKEFQDFVYSISHDLSAPTRAVVEFSNLLQQEQVGALSEESKLYLSLIVENGKKLQAMLSGLVEYSRLNTLAKTLSDVDCNVILEHCQIVLGDKIKETGALIEVEKLSKVKADAEQIMQLFLILLDNSLKFKTRDGKPRIWVSVEEQPNQWVFRMRDNGIGIESAFRSKLFKPFHRLHSDEEYPGIGMGLAMARRIAERHKGEIGIESSIYQGTTIYFTFPKGQTANG